MKKILMILVVLFSVSGVAKAIGPELSVSYGGYTQMDATDCKDGWKHVNNAWGAVNAGLNFRVTRALRLGLSYTFSSTTTKHGPDHSKIAYHAIMLNGMYDYYRNSIVTLYGHLGLGAEISHMMPRHHDSYNKSYFAYQISPLGAQVGLGRSAALFGELGFGAQGLLQVGFRFSL